MLDVIVYNIVYRYVVLCAFVLRHATTLRFLYAILPAYHVLLFERNLIRDIESVPNYEMHCQIGIYCYMNNSLL